MQPPPTTLIYITGVGRAARRLVRRHAIDALWWVAAFAVLITLVLYASYATWAWRDIGFACDAHASDHCLRPISDPALRARRDLDCRVRADDCRKNFLWLAFATMADDGLLALRAAAAHIYERVYDPAITLLLLVLVLAAVRQVVLWVGQPIFSAVAMFQTSSLNSMAPSPAKAE